MKNKPTSKHLVVIRGKGTPAEQRIRTNIKVYWSQALQRGVPIPGSD